MSQPLAVLDRTEREVAALLTAGLATRRGGREQLEELAGELSALKLERLAAELRRLSSEQDPAAMAAAALTAVAMVRKFRERLLPWPERDAAGALPFPGNPSLLVALPRPEAESADVPTLIARLETGADLSRAGAAALLVGKGEDVLPDLARPASKGTVAVRREAIAAIGRIGGETALKTLIGLLGDASCWRQLLLAVLPFGQAAVPFLTAALVEKGPAKNHESRQLMAAALLYRLGAYGELEHSLPGLAGKDVHAPALGIALAAQARAGGGWKKPMAMVEGVLWEQLFMTEAMVNWARAETTGELDRLLLTFEDAPVDEARTVARWMGCGSPIEAIVAEHSLGRLASVRTKERDRAAAMLRGIADPNLVTRLESALESGETTPALVARILGEAGGSHALGMLLDMVRRPEIQEEALKALKQLGDPGSAPGLLELLMSHTARPSVESALISLGDGAVDHLAGEMRRLDGTLHATRIQQILLQINTRRAKEALKGTEPESVDALFARLGHPRLGEGAARALARQGEGVLDRLEALVTSGAEIHARLNALKVIGGIKGPRAEEVLYQIAVRALSNTKIPGEGAVCARGLELLARNPDERVVDLLVRGVASGAWMVQEASVHALIEVGQSAAPLLMPLLDHSEPSVRARAVEVLGKLEYAPAEEKVVALLADPIPHVRVSAVAALGPIGAVTRNPRTVEALVGTLRHTMWPRLVFEALIQIGDPAAVPQLRRYALEARAKTGLQYLQHQAEDAIKSIEAAHRTASREPARKAEAVPALAPGEAAGNPESPAPPAASQGLMGKLRRFLGGS